MKKLTAIGGIVIVFMALATLIGTSWTFAQDDPTPDAPAPDTQKDPGEPGGFGQDGRRGPIGPRGGHLLPVDHDAIQSAMAEALGLSVEELNDMKADGMTLTEIAAAQGVAIEDVQAAVQAVVAEAVETAVAEGTLTREQADQILERAAQFGLKRFGPRGGFGPHLLDGEAMKTAVAAALGITVEELDAYHAEGLRLPEIAEELGVAMEDVTAALQEARTAAIEQAVEDGTLTQEQADRLLEGGGPGFGRGFGGGHGLGGGFKGPRGFGGGRFFNQPQNGPAIDAQDA